MRKILVPVDFSEVTDRVIIEAARLARTFSAELWLLYVALPPQEFVGTDFEPPVARKVQDKSMQEERAKLQQTALKYRQAGIKTIPLFIQGPLVKTILEQAEKLKADLIVMGSHGHGAIYSNLLGSVTEGVLRETTIPLYIVPAGKS